MSGWLFCFYYHLNTSFSSGANRDQAGLWWGRLRSLHRDDLQILLIPAEGPVSFKIRLWSGGSTLLIKFFCNQVAKNSAFCFKADLQAPPLDWGPSPPSSIILFSLVVYLLYKPQAKNLEFWMEIIILVADVSSDQGEEMESPCNLFVEQIPARV